MRNFPLPSSARKNTPKVRAVKKLSIFSNEPAIYLLSSNLKMTNKNKTSFFQLKLRMCAFPLKIYSIGQKDYKK
jgi:hypothetical protein